MPLCTWVVNFMPLLEQSCIIKIHARSTLKEKMIVASQLICFPHSQVARLALLQALKPNLHLNLSVLFALAKKTEILCVTKPVTSHPWLCNQVHLKEESEDEVSQTERRNVCPLSIHQFQEKDLSVVHFCQQFKVPSPPIWPWVGSYCHGKQEMNAACSEIKRNLKFSSLGEDMPRCWVRIRVKGGSGKLAKSKHLRKVKAEQQML